MKGPARLLLESPGERDRGFVLEQIRRGIRIHVVEPFHAYHHQGVLMFFPAPLPPFVEDLVGEGRVHLVTAESIGSREIYFLAAERAVEHVERIYPAYRSKHGRLISAVTALLDSGEAERIFKKRLCEQLAIFFSMNITLERVLNALGPGELAVHSRIDVRLYRALESLIAEAGGIDILTCDQIQFSESSKRRSHTEALIRGSSIFVKLLLQSLASLVPSGRPDLPRREYRFGVAINAPQRQFRGNMRGPDFLIDGEKIRKSETAFFPLVPLQPEHVAALRALGSDVVLLPAPGTFFSEGKKWWLLLQASLREFPFGYREVEGAAANLFNYLRWKYILSRTGLKNFITHADFGDVHVSRNIALKQSGATTWYYTDASNFGLNFRDEDGPWNRHPFWTYLHYDHFLTWYDYLAEYFAMHPGSFQDTKTVGCVWSQHIGKGSESIFSSVFGTGREPLDDRFKIVVFASTYTVNGVTSYDEAIAFLEDIRRLADELGQTSVIVKEKKAKELHLQADPVKGSQLLGILDDLSANPRIHVFTRDADTSQLIGDSDLCISFPFTSPTIEALSVDRPALWHDPQGIYRSNIYSEFDHVVTHGYDELKDTVLKHMRNRENRYDNPIPEGHPLIDPFRDGKAIERFRDLLCAAE